MLPSFPHSPFQPFIPYEIVPRDRLVAISAAANVVLMKFMSRNIEFCILLEIFILMRSENDKAILTIS